LRRPVTGAALPWTRILLRIEPRRSEMLLSEPNVVSRAVANSVRVLIVDDEPFARTSMRRALGHAHGVELVGECVDGTAAVDAIQRQAPDVVFMDVDMPGLNGFDVLDRVDATTMPAVVFVTALESYAVRAFEVRAVDYVLKPFAEERLVAALDRARTFIQERRNGELGRRLVNFVRDWQGDPPRERAVETTPKQARPIAESPRPSPAFIQRFAVRSDGRVRFVSATDVDWIEADGNYMVLHVGDIQHRLRASLTGLTVELDPKQFVRIHRSVIVNVGRIREVQPWFGGDYIALLHTGAKLKVSRLRAPSLLRPTA
jgi:two-component system, LytTR family, response regulator